MPVPSAITDLSTNPGSNYPLGSESPTGIDDYLRAHASFLAGLRDDIASLTAELLPSGIMFDYGGGAAPTGFLACDGSAVSRTTYANLYTAIGTIWGAGDGSTTFNLPDIRRRVTVGAGGTGTATLANTVGATGGEEKHTLTSAEMPVHNHTASASVSDPGHTHSYVTNSGVDGTFGSGAGSSNPTISTGSSTTGISVAVTVNNAGSGTSHNNLQPSAVVTKIIKI